MAGTAKKTKPQLWEKVKGEVTRSDKGGRPGQWSARKAQLATQEYKAEGGGYDGLKTSDNHLRQWTEADWGTESGAKSLDTGERYLPRKARETLTPEEYKRTTAKKRADTKEGRQFSRQPEEVARKVAPTRAAGGGTATDLDDLTRAELMERAAAKAVTGRSRMRKDELVRALGGRA